MRHRPFQTTLCAAALAPLLVCCGTAAEEPAPEPEAPPAFHFANGDLVISEFASDAVKRNLFDPCTEITEEEYAQAGIEGVGTFENEFGDDQVVMSCTSIDPSEDSNRRIEASVLSENSLKASGTKQIDHPQSSVPGLYTVREGAGSCRAQVDTERGAFAIGLWKNDHEGKEDAVCREAQQEMEKLYEAVSGDE